MVTKQWPIDAAQRAVRASASVNGMDRIIGLPGSCCGRGSVGKIRLTWSEQECDILFIDRSVNELQFARDHAFVHCSAVSEAPAEPAAVPS